MRVPLGEECDNQMDEVLYIEILEESNGKIVDLSTKRDHKPDIFAPDDVLGAL